MLPETLHAHTTISDGKLTHLELLSTCQKYNIGTVAFTDHDSLPKRETIKLLHKNKNHPVKWIIGIEISSGLPKELGGKPHGGFHVVGLFVDPTNQELLEYCVKAKEGRIVRMQKITKNLQSIGFDITEDDCLKASNGETITSPHIIEALQSKPNNLKRIQELISEMRDNAEKDPSIKKQYNEMINAGERHYPYSLFLSENAYIKDIYVKYLYSEDLDTIVSLIRSAGGAALIAHYTTIKKELPYEAIENLLKENRIDGMETVYGLWLYGTDKEKEIEEERDKIRSLVLKYDKISSGGADAHKEEDLKDFSEKTWYSSSTIGLAQKILQSGKVNSEWSSYS